MDGPTVQGEWPLPGAQVLLCPPPSQKEGLISEQLGFWLSSSSRITEITSTQPHTPATVYDGVYRPQRSPGSYPHKPDLSHRESLIETQHRAPPAPCAVVHLWAHRGHLECQLGFVSSRHQPPSDDNQQQS